jgi:hypothetical protein
MRIDNLKNFFAALILLLVIVGTASGDVIYVNDDAGGSNNGTSWADAYTDMQAALFSANSGDDIWVAAGTYKPGSSRDDSFQMKNGVTIYGGFPDTGDPNLSDRNPHLYETILSGDIGIEGLDSDNCLHVVYNQQGTNLDTSAVLDGFTITAGFSGSGYFGGGMANENASPTISNCIFRSNSAAIGGGMWNYNCSPILTNCIFHGNSASSLGGGLGNSVYCSPIITNCTFYDNTAAMYGGGIYNEGASSITLTNCILWADSAGTAGDEIHNNDSLDDVVTYCNVQSGTGQSWFGTGCIDEDPCFVDAAGGDFHLLLSSPCIDAGTNSAPSLPSTDFEGDTRIINGIVDMGVDECIGSPATSPSPADGAIMVSVDAQLSWTAGTGALSHDVYFDTDNPPTTLIADDILDTNCVPGTLDCATVYYWQVDENTAIGTITGNVWSFTTEIWEIWVDDDYWDGGDNDGHRWGIDAFDSIGAGIDMAGYGTTIHVAAGTYVENVTLKNGVALIGAGADDTLIDAGAIGSVVTSTGCDANTILDGFTLTNGNATNGGGMYNENGSPVIANCIFSGNFAATGGGIYNNSADARITNCVFQDNLTKDGANGSTGQNGGSGGSGAGMYNNHSSVLLTDCLFQNNSCGNGGNGGSFGANGVAGRGGNGGSGGGMYNYYCSPVVTHCYFKHNTSGNGGNGGPDGYYPQYAKGGNGGSGGAIFNRTSSAIVTHCVFHMNSSGSGGAGGDGMDADSDENGAEGAVGGSGGVGGAVYNYNCSPTLANCMFTGNSTGSGGDGGDGGYSSSNRMGADGGDAGNGGSGGSIYNNNSQSIIMNCTLAANKTGSWGIGGHAGDAGHSDGNSGSGGDGGGIYNSNNSDLIVTNCILWSNNAAGSGDEVYNYSSDPNFSYSDIKDCGGSSAGWNGSLGTDVGGNIDADPLFAGDLHLKSEFGRATTDPSIPYGTWLVDTVTSPCIDAGDPNMDVGNEPEGNGGRINMGYYGGTYQASKSSYVEAIEGDVNGDGKVDFLDFAIMAKHWLEGTEPEL